MAHWFTESGDFSEDVLNRMNAIDDFIFHTVHPHDPALEAALDANKAAGLDNIDVAANQGKLFQMLAKINGAKNILEVGTLGGYSTIWFARALPSGGKVISLELEPKHAEVARANIKNAGFEDKVDVRVGLAIETLAEMEAEGWGKEKGVFDMVFIDADKKSNWAYVEYALKFARVGTVIVVDNIGRKGRLADRNFTQGPGGADAVGTRMMFEKMGKDKRLDTTAVQTIGCKGWDGFSVSLVVSL